MGRIRLSGLRLLAVLAVASVGGLIAAAQASGDDASVEAAYKHAMQRGAKRFKAATKRLDQGSLTPRRALKLFRTLLAVGRADVRAVRREHASTRLGVKARAALLHGLQLIVDGGMDLTRAYTAATHGHRGSAQRLLRRSDHLAKEAPRYAKRAKKLFALARKLPPDTRITLGPNGVATGPLPTFAFTATKAKSKFQCQFDGAPLAPCTSPFTPAAPLAPGAHTFTVLATDPAGHADRTPATAAFTVQANG